MRLDPTHKREEDGRCDLEALMCARGTSALNHEVQLTGPLKKLDPRSIRVDQKSQGGPPRPFELRMSVSRILRRYIGHLRA